MDTGSRRAADKLIDQGRIQVNGKAVVMGQKVSPQDRIEVDGILVENHQEGSVYIAFNKPKGIVCTTDTRVEKDNIIGLHQLSKSRLSHWSFG